MKNIISEFLRERIDGGDFPSAVYLVAEKGEIVFHDALGFAVVEPERIEARLDTIYDLASLTKPLVTGLLISQIIESNELEINGILSDYLNKKRLNDKSDLTALALLTHTSGLPAWKPFYLLVDDPFDVEAEILRTKRKAPRPEVIYSDLNFLLLVSIVWTRLGGPLDRISNVKIFEPLELGTTFFNPPINLRKRIAASEKGNGYEKQTCIELGYLKPPATAGGTDSTVSAANPKSKIQNPTSKNPPAYAGGSDLFRNYQIWGEVHDGNAYFMGGVAGHAGLFSTAEEVFKISQQFLPKYTTLLKPETCKLFRTNFTKGMNEDRSIAFQLASTADSTAGNKMSRESFGHNGFTGTSLWIDPVKERIFILLTNRTHAHSLPFANINGVRRRFHDLAVDLLDKNIATKKPAF